MRSAISAARPAIQAFDAGGEQGERVESLRLQGLFGFLAGGGEVADDEELAGLSLFRADEWQQLGQMLRRFHLAGAYHSDMNCHNMLLDPEGKFWLLDFDKCAFRSGQDWQQGTMDRLLRSLRKEARLTAEKAQPFYWQETDWALLLQGYQE
mgnify:CR=1 FL=1